MKTTEKARHLAFGMTILLTIGAGGQAGAATPGPLRSKGEAASPLTLTYVANMGVLMSAGDTKVLIDALFDRPNPDYRAPAPETIDKIMRGEAPFDGVDLVLVTHNHPDHFDAGLAVRYLEAHAEPLLLAPADAVEAMRGAAADWAKIGPRVVAIDLKAGEKEARDPKGIPLTACRTLHSGDRDSPMNLMFLFELGGRGVLHEGDPNGRCEIFQAFGLKDVRLDLAIVHYWYPLEPNCARFIQEDLKVDHIALTHLPVRLEGDAPGKIDLVRQYYKDIFLLLPGTPAKIMAPAPPQPQDILNAVKNCDLELVQSLLKEAPQLIRAKDEYKNSLLYLALLKNDFRLARFLIESGIDVHYARQDTGGNEIFGAIQVGSLEITKLILEKGADIRSAKQWGNSPLEAAIFGGRKDIAYFLMDKGAALDIQGQSAPRLLRAALSAGMDRITNLLIKEQGVDHKNIDGLGNTLLHAAARSGETTFIGLLVDKGVDPNARNIYGWSPLHVAASLGHQKVIEALIRSGADKRVRTMDGQTPFNIADALGPKEFPAFLKKKGFPTAPLAYPKISALYIDPDLPGATPARFATGIVSQPHHFEHSKFSFSEDMKTACWADWQRTGTSKVFVMENKDGAWQAPRTVLLNATMPFIAPDGKRIFFTASRVLPDGREAGDSDIYYIQRTEAGWSDRVNLGPSVNTEIDEIQPSVTRDGTVYFAHRADIYRSKPIDGRYGPKEKLPAPINDDTTQAQPFIAPDGSFLLFRSLGQGGVMDPNFYHSSANADGAWTEPVNIAKKVNKIGLFPSLTPDRKFMIYFEGGDYFWFDIGAVMEELTADPVPARKTFDGQARPGPEPVMFGPDVLDAGACPHGQLAFSADGKDVFWSAIRLGGREQTIYHSVFDGTSFSRPAVAPFAAPAGNGGPAFSVDGKRLYFSAELPPESGSTAARTAICYIERTAAGWTRPVPIAATVDDRMTKGQVSVARGGNIYFSGRVLTERMPAIYVCRYADGRYAPPEKLAGPIGEVPLLVDPWVDPDEKFLLVSCPPPAGPPMLTDIGISFRREDGSWGEPARLGPAVNTGAFERFPSLSRDGKFLFFIRSLNEQFVGDQARFYRVEADVLAGLKPGDER